MNIAEQMKDVLKEEIKAAVLKAAWRKKARFQAYC